GNERTGSVRTAGMKSMRRLFLADAALAGDMKSRAEAGVARDLGQDSLQHRTDDAAGVERDAPAQIRPDVRTGQEQAVAGADHSRAGARQRRLDRSPVEKRAVLAAEIFDAKVLAVVRHARMAS